MFSIFNHISTWLCVEIFGTSCLIFLNLIVPILLIFISYRSLINFYFSSVTLVNSLINSLYLFYLIQTVREKSLTENNCRAIYYLQTSCILVLGRDIFRLYRIKFISKKKIFRFRLYDCCYACKFCFISVSFANEIN